MLRLSYFPVTWKFAQIVMLPKPGKPANEASSYRPISLLPISSKIFENSYWTELEMTQIS
jgi:hypothetical protein